MEIQELDLDFEISADISNGVEQEFFDKVKELNITEIEPLLGENTKIFGELEKYRFLIILRDLFAEFKRLGDTKILVDKGTCSEKCFGKPKDVFQFKGNNSKQTIFFAIEEHQGNLKFHGCMNFIDQFGEEGKNYQKLTFFVVKRTHKLEREIKDQQK